MTQIKGIETFDGVITDYNRVLGHGLVRVQVPIMIDGVPVYMDATFKFDLSSYTKTRKTNSSVPDVGVAAKVILNNEGQVIRVTQDGKVYHHMNLSTLSFDAISDGHKKAILHPFDTRTFDSGIYVGDCIEVYDHTGLRSVIVAVTYIDEYFQEDHVTVYSIQKVNT